VSDTHRSLHSEQIRDIHFAATVLAPQSVAASRTDRQDVLGLDGDLYPLVIRVYLPATFTRRTSRVRVRP